MSARCTGPCAQGRLPCTCTTGCAPRVIPTRHGLLSRFWRWLHDAAEIHAIECRRITLADLDDSLFERIQELKSIQFLGSPEAAAEAAREIKSMGARRDEVHAEDLRLRQRLALLGE